MSDMANISTENVDGLIRDMMTSLVHSTKSSHSLPAGSDYEYFSNFKEFREGMGNLFSQLTEQIQHICRVVQQSDDVNSSFFPADLSEAGLYDVVVDMIDVLLESADSKMENISGENKLSTSIRDTLKTDKDRIFVEKCKDMPKPQLQFLEDIDNSRRRPFRPRLREKPHNVVPLDISEVVVEIDPDDTTSAVGPSTYYPHPYTQEILGVCNRSQYHSQIADAAFVGPEMPSAGQAFELVESLEALERMAEELDGVKEVAVDLEHHHWRTFLGLTCLMQISCRDKDYIVDVLALRQHIHILLPLFADPDVIKVFHGCEKDIMWLQRDLGLYVVNCFDTYQAAKVLRYPALSLAHLLKFYCGVTLNKKYQLADWRERPLPPHLIEYAKLDTHYLLYIYDCLRRDVHASHGKNGVEAVYESSRRTCLQRYEKEPFYPLGYLKLISSYDIQGSQSGKDLTFEQNAALSSLWNWRDMTARRTDESCGYIMSNAELLRIGMSVASDPQAVIASGPLSEYVRQHVEEVASVVKELFQNEESQRDIDTTSEFLMSHADESFELNINSPSRVNKKRSSFEIGAGGSRHQMGRMQGYTTVTDFTPRLPSVPLVSSFNNSSVTPADDNNRRNHEGYMEFDLKKLFEEAKWSSQNTQPSSIKVESPTDPVLGGDREDISGINTTMMSRIEKSENELQQYSIFNEKSKFDSQDDTEEIATNTSISNDVKQSTKPSDDVEVIDALPKSLSDIYAISNRNRWRNKDKKRNRDNAEAPALNILDSTETSNSNDWYHVDKDKKSAVLDNMDSTLEFASEIGWVGKDERSHEEIRKKHLSNESTNNSTGTTGQQGSQHDHSLLSSGDSLNSSFDSKKSGAKYSKQGSGKEKAHSKDSNYFDYSRVANTNVMGAMSTVNTGVTDRDIGKYNPFLSSSTSQGGNGGYSNASNRSNNNNATKSRKQPAGGGKNRYNQNTVERRDNNRSHIFSASTNR